MNIRKAGDEKMDRVLPTVQGVQASALLSCTPSVSRSAIDGGMGLGGGQALSAYDQAKLIKNQNDRLNERDPLKKLVFTIEDIQKRGGFGLTSHGSALRDRILRLQDGIDFLDLSNTPTVDILVEAFTPYLKHKKCVLKHLNLINTRITMDGAVTLAESLKDNSTMETVQLSTKTPWYMKELRCEVNSTHDASHTKNGSSRQLDFSHRGYGPLDAAFLGTFLLSSSNQTCEQLNLSQNPWMGKANAQLVAVAILAKGLASLSTLLELNLRGIDFRSEGLVHFASAFHQLAKLRRVNLSKNALAWNIAGQRNQGGLKALCLALRQNSSIQHLNLSENELDHDDCPILCGMITVNISVNELDISKNALTSTGLMCFAESFERNSFLKKVNLSDTCMDDAALVAISGSIHHYNRSIDFLDLSENHNIHRDGYKELVRAMQNNPKLTKIILPDTKKYKTERRLLQKLMESNADLTMIHQNLSSFDLKSLSDFSVVNFLNKMNFLTQDERQQLLANESFCDLRMTENTVSALRYFSSVHNERITQNLLQVFGTPDRCRLLEAFMTKQKQRSEEDELWEQDLYVGSD